MKNETALITVPRMATHGQMKEINTLMLQAVPELTFEVATAIIGNKGEFLTKAADLFPNPAILADPVKQWEDFYDKTLDMVVDLSQVKIPPRRQGFNRLIIIAKGLSMNRVYDACAKHFNCWRYNDDLYASVTKNDRTSAESYAIWVKDTVEADENLKNLSADSLKEKKIKGVTLLERMLHELKYFRETRKHLDISNVTLCSGSRDSDGRVPDVCWNVSEFKVDWYDTGLADPYLRAREAVTL